MVRRSFGEGGEAAPLAAPTASHSRRRAHLSDPAISTHTIAPLQPLHHQQGDVMCGSLPSSRHGKKSQLSSMTMAWAEDTGALVVLRTPQNTRQTPPPSYTR